MIIIRCVHPAGSEKPEFPLYREDTMLIYSSLPKFHWNPWRWFKFFREIKSCMILVWAVPSSWSQDIPLTAKLFFRFCGRIILKYPWSGPGIIIDERLGVDPILEKLGDIKFVDESHFSEAVKKAYFLGECGSPKSMYRLSLNKERLKFLKNQTSGRTLEIGCSTGYVLDYVGGGIGIDIDPLRIEYARENYPTSQFFVQDAIQTDFQEQSFDTILIPEILEHVPFPIAERIVSEAKRIGKKVVITVPNAEKPNYDRELVENPDHKWFPTQPMVRQLLGPKGKIFESPKRDFIYAIYD